jgi:type II secretory pathway component PulF
MLCETVAGVRMDIESGISFSEALAKHPKVFNPLYVAMIRAGEAGGVLEESLERTADQLEKDDNLRRQVKGAMAYPAVVLSFALCTLLALIAFIVPVFVGIFKDFGGKLPFITQTTVNASTPSRSGRSPHGAAPNGTRSAFASPSTSARPSRRSRSRAGRARSRRSTPPASRSCRPSR